MKYISIPITALTFLFINPTLVAQDEAYYIGSDISSSISQDSIVEQKTEGFVKRFLYKSLLQNESASIFTGFLFQNSASPVNLKLFEFNPNQSTRSKRSYTQMTLKNVLNSVFGDHPVGNETHILVSLRHISTVVQKHKRLTVILLSDMQEWSGFRKMSPTRTFASMEQAISAGKQDAQEVMKKYGLQKNTTSKVSFEIFMPLSQTDDTQHDFIFEYWHAVLGTFFDYTLNYRGL